MGILNHESLEREDPLTVTYKQMPEVLRNTLLMKDIAGISHAAGKIIMEVYNDPDFLEKIGIERKFDDSPFTIVDTESDKLITNQLLKITPNIPVLSEEAKDLSYDKRKDRTTYRCVDPLDGTEDFIRRTGDFCVNIALMHERQPVMSVIYQPVSGDTYIACKGMGAHKISPDGAVTKLKVKVNESNDLVLGVSRSTRNKESIDTFCEHLHKKGYTTQRIQASAAKKYCLVAAGEVDLYPCFGPTSERDSAAGQLLVTEAGGYFIGVESVDQEYTTVAFPYNKQNLLNGRSLSSNRSHEEYL